MRDGAIVIQRLVKADDDGHRRIELAEAAHHPILAALLVVAFDPHGSKELFRDADLPVAVDTGIGPVIADFTHRRHALQHTGRIPFTDFLKRFAGQHMQMPRLGVHRGWRAIGQCDDLFQQGARHGVFLEAPDAAPFLHCLFQFHLALPQIS